MWVLFGSKTKAKPVPTGREEIRPCGKCGQATRHIECDIIDALHVFFIELADTTHGGRSVDQRQVDISGVLIMLTQSDLEKALAGASAVRILYPPAARPGYSSQ